MTTNGATIEVDTTWNSLGWGDFITRVDATGSGGKDLQGSLVFTPWSTGDQGADFYNVTTGTMVEWKSLTSGETQTFTAP